MPEKITVKQISKQTLIHCAVECIQHSKLKDAPDKQKISVIYTLIKNVSKADKPGAVYTKQTKCLHI
jgi:predicted ribosome quality control (RQC) complex YloA/Tae2 family protein